MIILKLSRVILLATLQVIEALPQYSGTALFDPVHSMYEIKKELRLDLQALTIYLSLKL